MTDAEIRAWARRCYEVTKGRMPESLLWELIADHGHDWKPKLRKGQLWRGGGKLPVRHCFYNAAATVRGEEPTTIDRCQYAEGFAQTDYGMWMHHAWVVLPSGLAVDRTWDRPGLHYVGVIVDPIHRESGDCQAADIHSVGIAWGPSYENRPAVLDLLFDRSPDAQIPFTLTRSDDALDLPLPAQS